jgi:hypothetical protein
MNENIVGNRDNFPGYQWTEQDNDNSTVQPTRYTCYLKLFIFVKRFTCFGRSFRPSSGAQNCV